MCQNVDCQLSRMNKHCLQMSNTSNNKHTPIFQYHKITKPHHNLSLTPKNNTCHTHIHEIKSITLSTNNNPNVFINFSSNKHQPPTYHIYIPIHTNNIQDKNILQNITTKKYFYPTQTFIPNQSLHQNYYCLSITTST